MTQAGQIAVARIYLRCVKCGGGGTPADERLGITGRYSPQAQRLICLAAGRCERRDRRGDCVRIMTFNNVSQRDGPATPVGRTTLRVTG